MSKTLYIIKRDGQGSGGFLSPPGHPSHFYSVEGYYGGKIKPVSGPDLIAGLDYLIEDKYNDVPARIKERAQQIMASAELVCSEAWLRNVYGYFRHSYSPDGIDRNVSNSISSNRLYCQCGQDFWNRNGLDRHLSGLSIPETYLHFEIAKPIPPVEHHLGYMCVREFFPDHTPRLDLIENPETTGPAYGTHMCPKCGNSVQYEARLDAWAVISAYPRWTANADCPEGGKHE